MAEDATAVTVAPEKIPSAAMQWTGSVPQVLTASVASAYKFDVLLDLLPRDDSNFLLPVHPDSDARAPLTYEALRSLASALRTAPALSELAYGARVAAALPNGPELATCMISLTALGFAFAPLNPDLGVDEISFELSDLPAAALIAPASQRGSTAQTAASNLGIRSILRLQPNPSLCGFFQLSSSGTVSGHKESSHGAASEPREAIALLMHTSGTTRRPKRVPLSHRQLGIGAMCVASTLRLQRSDVSLNVSSARPLTLCGRVLCSLCSRTVRLRCAANNPIDALTPSPTR